MDNELKEQYEEIAMLIEPEGIGYAVIHYMEPNTNDEKLNEAIRKAQEGISTIENIVRPFMP